METILYWFFGGIIALILLIVVAVGICMAIPMIVLGKQIEKLPFRSSYRERFRRPPKTSSDSRMFPGMDKKRIF